MIKITHLNDQEAIVNAELIEFVEATPDTLITLTTGKKIMVKESVGEICEAVKKYKTCIFSAFLDYVRKKEE
jgi:flagellar protein FlbD